MAELLKVEITRQDLVDGEIPANMVLCEEIFSAEGAKTKSGIIYGVNTDINYGSDDLDDKTSHPADMAQVALRVYKLPEKLYFNPDDPDKSMPWETDMELWEDDFVWTNIIETLNAITLVCEGVNYKLIPYSDIIIARREYWVNKWVNKKAAKVFTINGYILCTQIMKEKLSDLDIISTEKIDMTKGKVAFLGEPNKRYVRPEYTDFEDLQVGDTVLWDKKYIPYLLERQTYASKFDENKLYWVVPRRRIVMVLNRET
jgi:hypothetical protein